MIKRKPGRRRSAHHGGNKEHQIADHNTNKPAECAEGHRYNAKHKDGFQWSCADQNRCNLDGGKRNRRHHNDIEEDTKIKRSKSSQIFGYLRTITDFIELQIGHDTGPSPEFGIDESCNYPGQKKRPPRPVSRDTMIANDICYQIGGVCCESGRHRRDAKQPPGHAATAGRRQRCCPGRGAVFPGSATDYETDQK